MFFITPYMLTIIALNVVLFISTLTIYKDVIINMLCARSVGYDVFFDGMWCCGEQVQYVDILDVYP